MNNNGVIEILNKLPNFKNVKRDLVCPICLETVGFNINICCLPCNHLFCKECIKDALEYDDKCPICRDSIRDRLEEIENIENNFIDLGLNQNQNHIQNQIQNRNQNQNQIQEIFRNKPHYLDHQNQIHIFGTNICTCGEDDVNNMINRQIEDNQNNPNFILNVDILKNFRITKIKNRNKYEIYDNIHNIPWKYECNNSNETQFKFDMFVLIYKIKKENNRNLDAKNIVNIWKNINNTKIMAEKIFEEVKQL